MRFKLVATALVCAAASYGIDIRTDLSNVVSTTPGNWNNISNLTGTTTNLTDYNTGVGTGVSITGSAN